MRAILKKTVSPNFKAGDILIGDRNRIKSLVKKNVAIFDSSWLANWGAALSIFSNFILSSFLFFMIFFPVHSNWIKFQIPWIWGLTLIGICSISTMLNMAYFRNVKLPYLTYFITLVTNPIAGTMIMMGHERMAASYQPKVISFSAGTTFCLSALLMHSIFILHLLDLNYIIFPNIPAFTNMLIYPLWVSIFVALIIVAIAYDINYSNRRMRFIKFVARTNAKTSYRAKILNAYKAYQKTGNSEEFIQQNIDILENTLNESRMKIEKL